MISIIMPVYNSELYLETALLSVLMQTNRDFELICIDDCSTDSSLKILENYSNLDSRIKVFKNSSNKGAAFCRNKAIKMAKGDYIFFLDSDDWINFNTLEILESYAKSNNLDILMFKFMTYWNESNSFSIEPFYDMKFMNKYIGKVFNHMDLEPNSLFDIPGANCNKLFSRKFIVKNKVKYPEGLIYEDTAVFFEYMIKAKRISLIDEYFYNRRRRKNSVMTNTGRKLFDSIPIAKDLMSVFLKDPNIYERYKKGVINITFLFLKGRYNLLDNNLKEDFIKKTNDIIKELDEKYGILNDIENNLDGKNWDLYNLLPYNKNNLSCTEIENFKILYRDDVLISNLKMTDKFEKTISNIKNKNEKNRKSFLTFIFKKLKEKCILSEENIREQNFQQCKYLINRLYSEFDLYQDILKFVDYSLIDFFNQEYIEK